MADGLAGLARFSRPYDFTKWEDDDFRMLNADTLSRFSQKEITDLTRELLQRGDLDGVNWRLFLSALLKVTREANASFLEQIQLLEDTRNLRKQQLQELKEQYRSLTMPVIQAIALPLCNEVVSSRDVRPSSLHESSWLLPIPRLQQWEDFSLEHVIPFVDGHTIGREAIVPNLKFDRSWNEATASGMFASRCFSPLLTHIFRLESLKSKEVELLYDSMTVVTSRPDQVWTAVLPEKTSASRRRAVLVHEHKEPATFPDDDSDRPIWEHLVSAPEGTTTARAGMMTRAAARAAVRPAIHPAARPVARADGEMNWKTQRGLEQVYAYMVTLGLKYGVISNTENTWFLCREDCVFPSASGNGGDRDDDVLKISRPFSCLGTGDRESTNVAYLATLLLAIGDENASGKFPARGSSVYVWALPHWRAKLCGADTGPVRTSLDQAGACEWVAGLQAAAIAAAAGGGGGRRTRARHDIRGRRLPLTRVEFGALLPLPWDEAYEPMPMFEDTTSSIQRLRLPNGVSIVIKTLIIPPRGSELSIDELRAPYDNETRVYTALQNLQGGAIPLLVYGGEVGFDGDYFVIATIDSGDCLSTLSAPLSSDICDGALAALTRVHAAGYCHGDVALWNFVVSQETGHVRIIDLARAVPLPSRKADRDEMIEAEVTELRSRLAGHKNDHDLYISTAPRRGLS